MKVHHKAVLNGEGCYIEFRKVAMQIEACGRIILLEAVYEVKVAFHKAESNWGGLRRER